MAKENKVKDSEELLRAISELEKEKEISKVERKRPIREGMQLRGRNP